MARANKEAIVDALNRVPDSPVRWQIHTEGSTTTICFVSVRQNYKAVKDYMATLHTLVGAEFDSHPMNANRDLWMNVLEKYDYSKLKKWVSLQRLNEPEKIARWFEIHRPLEKLADYSPPVVTEPVSSRLLIQQLQDVTGGLRWHMDTEYTHDKLLVCESKKPLGAFFKAFVCNTHTYLDTYEERMEGAGYRYYLPLTNGPVLLEYCREHGMHAGPRAANSIVVGNKAQQGAPVDVSGHHTPDGVLNK